MSSFGELGVCSACPWVGRWEARHIDNEGNVPCPWCRASAIEHVPLPPPSERHYTRVQGQCDACDAYPTMRHSRACAAPAAGRVVAAAMGILGLGANPGRPARRELYAEAVGPLEAERRRRELASLSGCGLVAREILRRAGVRHPAIDQPYRDRRAVSDLLEIARSAGAARRWSSKEPPLPGQILIVGGVIPGEIEHVYTVVTTDASYAEADTILLSTIDGGQRDGAGWQVVERRDRRITLGVDYVSAGTDPGAERSRHVEWVIDAPRIVDVLGA